MPRSLLIWLAALTLVVASPAAATPVTIDFEDFVHGDVVTVLGAGFSVVADNPNRSFDIAAVFDTNRSNTEDADLERGSGWRRGNLGPNADLGNVLILQENDFDCASGRCSVPDDEGRRAAGSFRFSPIPQGIDGIRIFQDFAFDLIDVDSETLENGSITFHLGVDDVVTHSFASFLGLGQDVAYGNNSANRIVLEGIGNFDGFTIALGGSGAIDNIVLSNARVVPEPSTLLLFGLGLAGLGATRGARH